MNVNLMLIQRLDNLIYRKATGCPEKLAQLLKVSERTLFNYLQYMKEDLNLPIQYNAWRQTYFYEKEGRLIIKFLPPYK